MATALTDLLPNTERPPGSNKTDPNSVNPFRRGNTSPGGTIPRPPLETHFHTDTRGLRPPVHGLPETAQRPLFPTWIG